MKESVMTEVKKTVVPMFPTYVWTIEFPDEVTQSINRSVLSLNDVGKYRPCDCRGDTWKHVVVSILVTSFCTGKPELKPQNQRCL
jgi:hypothetical protein